MDRDEVEVNIYAKKNEASIQPSSTNEKVGHWKLLLVELNKEHP